MLEQPITAQQLTRAILLPTLSLLWGSFVQAAEQRCTDLGSNCLCSEPMNTTTFAGGPPFWNPADSTTKECSTEGVTGGAISRNDNDISGSADSTAIAALPPGHTLAHFMRASDQHDGIFFAGNGQSVSSSFVRIAARWYIWHTTTFDFKLEGTCDNSKIAEFDNDSRVDYTGGFHTYNYLKFSPSIDCCVSGPGPNSGVASSQMKGKWWRFEAVITNRNSANYDLKFYGKNITDNGPELTLIDLSTDSRVNHLTPPSLMSSMMINNYRQAGAGPCRGWIGISHYMLAGWTTNAGQRIGAAKEVEGGGVADTTPPPSPPNLKVQ
jgi:hypothetical protein